MFYLEAAANLPWLYFISGKCFHKGRPGMQDKQWRLCVLTGAVLVLTVVLYGKAGLDNGGELGHTLGPHPSAVGCVCLYLLPFAHLVPYPRSTGVFVRPWAFPHLPESLALSPFSQFLVILLWQFLHREISCFALPASVLLEIWVILASCSYIKSSFELCYFHFNVSPLHVIAVKVPTPVATLQKQLCWQAAESFFLNTEAWCCRNSFSSLISPHQLAYSLSVCECKSNLQIRKPLLFICIFCQ